MKKTLSPVNHTFVLPIYHKTYKKCLLDNVPAYVRRGVRYLYTVERRRKKAWNIVKDFCSTLEKNTQQDTADHSGT